MEHIKKFISNVHHNPLKFIGDHLFLREMERSIYSFKMRVAYYFKLKFAHIQKYLFFLKHEYLFI